MCFIACLLVLCFAASASADEYEPAAEYEPAGEYGPAAEYGPAESMGVYEVIQYSDGTEEVVWVEQPPAPEDPALAEELAAPQDPAATGEIPAPQPPTVLEVPADYAPTDLLIWNDNGKVWYTDMEQRPISGEWCIQGVNYVLADDGSVLAGGGELGTKGRFYVPELGIDVPVNTATNEDAQHLTDLEASAAYMRYSLSRYYIADHNDQEFVGLMDAFAGAQAYLFTERGIEAFECTDVIYGHNIEWGLTDEEGNDIIDRIPTNGFVAYTCLDTWENVRISFWDRTWIAPSSDEWPVARLEREDARSVPMERADSSMEVENRIQVPMSVAQDLGALSPRGALGSYGPSGVGGALGGGLTAAGSGAWSGAGVLARFGVLAGGGTPLADMRFPARQRAVFPGVQVLDDAQRRSAVTPHYANSAELLPRIQQFRLLIESKAR